MELSEKTLKYANTALDMLHKDSMEDTIETGMKVLMKLLDAKAKGCKIIIRNPEGEEKALSLR